MAPSESKPDEERSRRVESLGWLTESAVMPKKQRVIEGVGASSAVELRAQLYKSQEEHRRMQEGGPGDEGQRGRRKAGGKGGGDLFAEKNAGVEERAQRDKLQLKATESGADSYAALERKAQLYEKLVRGELPDEEAKEKYSVDFLRKGFLDEEKEEMERERRGEGAPATESRDGDRWPPGNESGQTHMEHKHFIREVNKETNEAREQAAGLKQRRQAQADKNREKLRQAFLKKQLEKLHAAKQKQKQLKQERKSTHGSVGLGTSIETQT